MIDRLNVSADDISLLSDLALRELVARLCEAEVRRVGRSGTDVTWGGDQDAPDGGIDVRVDLPSGIVPGGPLLRPLVGLQVKKPDMPPAQIEKEMAPGGTLRPAIGDLIARGGAYVIASSGRSVSDSALQARERRMREVAAREPEGDGLACAFLDSSRLASWANDHAGIAAWVLHEVGSGLVGWRGYGGWTNDPAGADGEYIVADRTCVLLPDMIDPVTPGEGLDQVRHMLSQPAACVRLIGLSGVGKTRFAQALFDARIGSDALDSAQVIYADLGDAPEPSPIALATQLRADGRDVLLVVDNCPPDVHRRLSDLIKGETTRLGVLTIEYDVADDQPEGTRVVELRASSRDAIETPVGRRHPAVTQVDARAIARFSDGNARVALALAGTVGVRDNIGELSDAELFRRLFH